jgi:ribonuclease HII
MEAPDQDDLLVLERRLWEAGFLDVAGVDEAGMGPLAGPVFAAAVVFGPGVRLEGVADSKTLSAHQRQETEKRILREAKAWAVACAEVEEIDRLNIYQAGLLAMRRAVEALTPEPNHLLVDGRLIPEFPIPQTRVVGGDRRSHCVAAASILAKTARDRRMVELDRLYPGYGFAEHKGYPTPAHREALARMGPSPIHRRSFAAVSEFEGTFSPRFFSIREQITSAGDLRELENLLTRAALGSPSLTGSEFRRIRELCSRRKRVLARTLPAAEV